MCSRSPVPIRQWRVGILILVLAGLLTAALPGRRASSAPLRGRDPRLNSATPLYTVTDLGPTFWIPSLNDKGQRVEWLANAANQGVPSLFLPLPDHGLPQGYTELSGLTPGTVTAGSALNNLGEVAGYDLERGASSPPVPTHATLWLPQPHYGLAAGAHDLTPDTAYNAGAVDISDSGQVLGSSTSLDNSTQVPWIWLPSAVGDLPAGPHDLEFLPGGHEAWAYALNARAQVVGTVTDSRQLTHPALWLPEPAYGMPSGLNLIDTGPDAVFGGASAINAHGEIAGARLTAGAGALHAYLWLPAPAYGLPAGVNDLPPLPGYPISGAGGINDLGQVVGSASVFVDGAFTYRAWIWQQGEIHELSSILAPESGDWVVVLPRKINNRGQILAFARRPDGQLRTVLLTPQNRIADLSFLPPAAPGAAKVGQAVTFTFRGSNQGPADAANVRLPVTLSGVVDVAALDTSQGSWSQAGNVITFQLGSLPVGAGFTASITVTPRQPGAVSVSALLDSDSVDLNTADNTSEAGVSVTQLSADLETQLSAPSSGTLGQNYTAVATAINHGPDPAVGVVLTVTPPANTTVVSATSPLGSHAPVDGTLTINAGDLPRDGRFAVTLVLRPTHAGLLKTDAQSSSSTHDPLTNNNRVSSDIAIPIPQGPDLTGSWEPVTLKKGPTRKKVILILSLRFTMRNNGTETASGPAVEYFLSADGKLEGATPFPLRGSGTPPLPPGANYPMGKRPGKKKGGYTVTVPAGKNGGSAYKGQYLIARIPLVPRELNPADNVVVSAPLP